MNQYTYIVNVTCFINDTILGCDDVLYNIMVPDMHGFLSTHITVCNMALL